jgi:prepilin peptidase CpaA
MLVAGGLLLPFHLGRGMGPGDVKLMAMVGAFLGPVGGLIAAALALVAGMLLGFIAVLGAHMTRDRSRLLVEKKVDVSCSSAASGVGGGGVRMLRFPYALAIGIGTLTSLWLFGASVPNSDTVFAPWIH